MGLYTFINCLARSEKRFTVSVDFIDALDHQEAFKIYDFTRETIPYNLLEAVKVATFVRVEGEVPTYQVKCRYKGNF